MSNPVISYDKKGFIINGKREYLIGGEFHYFRVPAAEWEDRLKKMKSTGANLISVYIAWNMHEPEEGKEIWDGDYDLNRFLTLCKKYGFYVLIKPGPYICAELDFGGHPDWLIAKVAKKEFRLRMLDEGYLKLCRKWYKTVSEKIHDHLITNGGPIIAAQIENEYDHLIEYGEETITVQDAIDYLLYLKQAMEDYGIDVPKFANEAAFLRGKGVIDTRTYYPNIPGLWNWEFALFENKIIDSKKSQTDSPVMILELQAGWFSQIGVPTYEPDLKVVEGVSKSVLIQGASIVNYYMMVGGTTFPFMGARGDVVFLGGLGNITSYDFGGSPIHENGELHSDKYYWIKGFIRFSKQFSDVILNSDGKAHVSIVAGGENVALLSAGGTELDYSVDKCYENFNIYEEGNENGRFLFIRNLEDEQKNLTLNISKDLMGHEITFKTAINAKETRMLPVAFKVPGTDVMVNYGTSEILLSKKYDNSTAFVVYGKNGTEGELSLNVKAKDVKVITGEVKSYDDENGCLLQYTHSDIQILQIKDVTLFIINEGLIGGVEELSSGLLFNNLYYLASVKENTNEIEIDVEIKENTDYSVRFFPMTAKFALKSASLGGNKVPLVKDKATNIYTAKFKTGTLYGKPEFNWTSDWSYKADTDEIGEGYDCTDWMKLDEPTTLEEAGFIEHGYYWYKTQFELDNAPGMIFMDYKHNDTDRMFIYINGNLVYKSHNKKIVMKDITGVLKKGVNEMSILYADEFHNKSHPHEGPLVKYSGIMNPFILHGTYADGSDCKLEISSFYLKKGLTGMNSGYHTLAYDNSGWQTTPDAEKFVIAQELGHVVWFRRNFRYNLNDKFSAPLKFYTKEADQRLTMYINGKPVARYDILGPQQEFHIPESYINRDGENVISFILECPAFYDELQGGFRRGYIYNPVVEPAYVSESLDMKFETSSN
jgi:hypothetical protein